MGKKQEGAKVDPYVKLQLGSFKKAPTLKSKVQKKKQRAAFSLGNEVLHFDIFDPSNMCLSQQLATAQRKYH